MRKKLLLCIILISALLLSGCSLKKEKLILATEAGFAPYEYYQIRFRLILIFQQLLISNKPNDNSYRWIKLLC